MQPAIIEGDYILVNKLVLGGRVYKNTHFMDGGKVETSRIKGFRKVRRNDVLVFNYPYTDWNKPGFDLNVFYVKRCIAIPGDTFYIENGFYKVKDCLDTLGCYEYQQRLSNKADSTFTKEIYLTFPFYGEYAWNVKKFGPLYIPRKDDVFEIDQHNIKLYKNLIIYETGKSVMLRNDSVFLDNMCMRYYQFQKNYYFMAGDYVFDSKDSRYWGLLPEDHIVGKASFIWQSKDINTGKRRWKRTFKVIN
jgi:signal peptidase I